MVEQNRRKLSSLRQHSIDRVEDVAGFLLDGPKSKTERYLFAALWVLRLEAISPDLRWKIVELSRKSGISRTWIYDFFGRNKRQILERAVELALEDIHGRSEERIRIKKEMGIAGSVFRSRFIFKSFPEIVVFYYRNINRDNAIGAMIRERERAFQIQLEKETGLKGAKLKNFRATIHGLATAPFLEDVDVKECLESLGL